MMMATGGVSGETGWLTGSGLSWSTPGDWVIESGDTVLLPNGTVPSGSTITINGDLTVESGAILVIDNMDIIIDVASTAKGITVEDGASFTFSNGTLDKHAAGVGYILEVSGNITINDATVADVFGGGYGIHLDGTGNGWFNDSSLTTISARGISVMGGSMVADSLTVSDTTLSAVHVVDGSATVCNSTFRDSGDEGLYFENATGIVWDVTAEGNGFDGFSLVNSTVELHRSYSLGNVYGLYVRGSNGSTIDDITINGTTKDGLYLENTSVTITGSSINASGKSGVYVKYSDPTISGSIISNNTENGVYLEDTSSGTYDDMIVMANLGHGIHVHGSQDTVIISDSTLEGNALDGVRLDGAGDVNVSGSSIIGNGQRAIFFNVSTGSTFENTMTGSNGTSIYILSSYVSLTNDTITGSMVNGVTVEDSTVVTLEGTSISETNGTGIFLIDSTVYILDSTIMGGNGSGIVVNGTTVLELEGGSINGTSFNGVEVNSGSVNITDTLIVGNTGAGVRARVSYVNITRGTMSNNDHGVIINGSTATINGTLFMAQQTGISVIAGELVSWAPVLDGNYFGLYVSGGTVAVNDIDARMSLYEEVYITGGTVSLFGGQVTGSEGTGIYISASATVDLNSVHVHNNSGDGMILEGPAIIYDSCIDNNTGAGIALGAVDLLGSTIDLTLTEIIGNEVGIELIGSTNITVAGGLLAWNTRDGLSSIGSTFSINDTDLHANTYGLYMSGGIGMLTNSSVTDNVEDGIFLEDDAQLTTGQVTVSDSVRGIYVVGADLTLGTTTVNSNGIGLFLIDMDGMTLAADVSVSDCTDAALAILNSTDVTISGGTYSSNGKGMVISNSTFTVDGVTLSGNTVGAVVDLSEGTFEGVTATSNTNDAIVIREGATVWIRNGTISASPYGLTTVGATVTVVSTSFASFTEDAIAPTASSTVGLQGVTVGTSTRGVFSQNSTITMDDTTSVTASSIGILIRGGTATLEGTTVSSPGSAALLVEDGAVVTSGNTTISDATNGVHVVDSTLTMYDDDVTGDDVGIVGIRSTLTLDGVTVHNVNGPAVRLDNTTGTLTSLTLQSSDVALFLEHATGSSTDLTITGCTDGIVGYSSTWTDTSSTITVTGGSGISSEEGSSFTLTGTALQGGTSSLFVLGGTVTADSITAIGADHGIVAYDGTVTVDTMTITAPAEVGIFLDNVTLDLTDITITDGLDPLLLVNSTGSIDALTLTDCTGTGVDIFGGTVTVSSTTIAPTVTASPSPDIGVLVTGDAVVTLTTMAISDLTDWGTGTVGVLISDATVISTDLSLDNLDYGVLVFNGSFDVDGGTFDAITFDGVNATGVSDLSITNVDINGTTIGLFLTDADTLLEGVNITGSETSIIVSGGLLDGVDVDIHLSNMSGVLVEEGANVSITGGRWTNTSWGLLVSDADVLLEDVDIADVDFGPAAFDGALTTMVNGSISRTLVASLVMNASLTLDGTTIMDVEFGIDAVDATLSLSGVTVSEVNGTGISLENGTLSMMGSTVMDAIDGMALINVTMCHVIDSTFNDIDYGIYGDSSVLNVTGTTITGASQDGIFVVDSHLEVVDTLIDMSGRDGIYLGNSSLVATDLTVNNASFAIYVIGDGPAPDWEVVGIPEVDITGGVFNDTIISVYGLNATLSLNGTVMENSSYAAFMVNGSHIISNGLDISGSGDFALALTASLWSDTDSSMTTSKNGTFVDETSGVELTGTTFHDQTYGVILLSDRPANLVRSATFQSIQRAAILVDAGYVDIEDTIFLDNGEISLVLSDGSMASVMNASFTGVGIDCEGSSLTVDSSSFTTLNGTAIGIYTSIADLVGLTFTDVRVGMIANASQVNLTDSTFTDGSYAMSLEAGSTGELDTVSVVDHDGDAVLVTDSDLLLTGGTFSGNNLSSLYVENSTVTVMDTTMVEGIFTGIVANGSELILVGVDIHDHGYSGIELTGSDSIMFDVTVTGTLDGIRAREISMLQADELTISSVQYGVVLDDSLGTLSNATLTDATMSLVYASDSILHLDTSDLSDSLLDGVTSLDTDLHMTSVSISDIGDTGIYVMNGTTDLSDIVLHGMNVSGISVENALLNGSIFALSLANGTGIMVVNGTLDVTDVQMDTSTNATAVYIEGSSGTLDGLTVSDVFSMLEIDSSEGLVASNLDGTDLTYGVVLDASGLTEMITLNDMTLDTVSVAGILVDGGSVADLTDVYLVNATTAVAVNHTSTLTVLDMDISGGDVGILGTGASLDISGLTVSDTDIGLHLIDTVVSLDTLDMDGCLLGMSILDGSVVELIDVSSNGVVTPMEVDMSDVTILGGEFAMFDTAVVGTNSTLDMTSVLVGDGNIGIFVTNTTLTGQHLTLSDLLTGIGSVDTSLTLLNVTVENTSVAGLDVQVMSPSFTPDDIDLSVTNGTFTQNEVALVISMAGIGNVSIMDTSIFSNDLGIQAVSIPSLDLVGLDLLANLLAVDITDSVVRMEDSLLLENRDGLLLEDTTLHMSDTMSFDNTGTTLLAVDSDLEIVRSTFDVREATTIVAGVVLTDVTMRINDSLIIAPLTGISVNVSMDMSDLLWTADHTITGGWFRLVDSNMTNITLVDVRFSALDSSVDGVDASLNTTDVILEGGDMGLVDILDAELTVKDSLVMQLIMQGGEGSWEGGVLAVGSLESTTLIFDSPEIDELVTNASTVSLATTTVIDMVSTSSVITDVLSTYSSLELEGGTADMTDSTVGALSLRDAVVTGEGVIVDELTLDGGSLVLSGCTITTLDMVDSDLELTGCDVTTFTVATSDVDVIGTDIGVLVASDSDLVISGGSAVSMELVEVTLSLTSTTSGPVVLDNSTGSMTGVDISGGAVALRLLTVRALVITDGSVSGSTGPGVEVIDSTVTMIGTTVHTNVGDGITGSNSFVTLDATIIGGNEGWGVKLIGGYTLIQETVSFDHESGSNDLGDVYPGETPLTDMFGDAIPVEAAEFMFFERLGLTGLIILLVGAIVSRRGSRKRRAGNAVTGKKVASTTGNAPATQGGQAQAGTAGDPNDYQYYLDPSTPPPADEVEWGNGGGLQ